MKLTDYLQNIGSPVAYYPKLCLITGRVTSTLFLCQLLYWYGKQQDEKGWIYKTAREIENETGLSLEEQKTARRKLQNLNFIKEKLAGVPATIHYQINFDAINNSWEEYIKQNNSILNQFGKDSQIAGIPQTGLRESLKLDCGNPSNCTMYCTEITTENTKEKELKKEKESFFSNSSSSSEPQTQNPKPKNLQIPSLEKNQPQDQDTNPVKTQNPSLEKAPTEPLAEFVTMPQEWLPAYCREILIDLNSKLGTDYKPTPAVKRLIQDRWKEGYREIEQYRVVHDNMIQAWYRDPKMKHNLNPSVLYSEKFQNYLNWTKIKTQKTSAVSNEIVYDYNGNPIKPLTSQQRKAKDERYEAMKREYEERAYKENCALLGRRDKEKQEAQKVLNTLKEKKIEVVSKTLSLSSEDWKTREKRREMQIQQARELIFMENAKKEKVITI